MFKFTQQIQVISQLFVSTETDMDRFTLSHVSYNYLPPLIRVNVCDNELTTNR